MGKTCDARPLSISSSQSPPDPCYNFSYFTIEKEAPMIALSPTATDEVKRLIGLENKPNLGLRIGVKGGGCSGLSYVLGLEEATPKQFDTVL